ncbi:beta-propeller fold lactonase family protein [Bacteroidota bacterium]
MYFISCSNETIEPPPLDTEGPIINHTQQPDVLDSLPIVLTAQILDAQLMRTVLYYKTKTSSDSIQWTSVEGIQDTVSKDMFNYKIPGQHQPVIVDYYVAAIDAEDNVSTLPQGGTGKEPLGNVPPPSLLNFNVLVNGVDILFNGFENFDVASILSLNCATSGCHVGNSPASGLSISNYSELLKGSTNRSNGTVPNYGGEDVIAYNSGKSLVYQFITNNVTPIAPHDAVSLTQEQITTLKTWIDNGAKDFNKNSPFLDPSYRVYVCNQSSDAVSVIDGDANVVSAIIDVDLLQSPDKPHMVKERDGFIYVTLISTAKLLKIRTSDYTIVGEVSGITKAGMIHISPDGTKAYVSRSSTSDPIFNTIFVVDITNMTVIKELLLPAPGVPHGIALSHDGLSLYVANLTLDRISIVDAVNDEFVEDIVLPQGTEPMQASISPDGKYLYISARGTNMLMVIDTETKSVVAEVPLAAGPMHIAVSSDGNKIYIPSMMGNVVNVVTKNGSAWSRTNEISHAGFNMMQGVDLTEDDRYLYVSSRNADGVFKTQFEVSGEGPSGTIGIIDTQTEQVIKLIEVEEFAAGLTVGN